MEEQNAQFGAALAICKDCIDDINNKVERIDHALRGNGKEGLITRVALIDQKVSEFERFVREVQSLRRWLMLGAISFASSLVWQAVQWVISKGS